MITDATLGEFIKAVQEFVNDGAAPCNVRQFSYDKGSKYIRIVESLPGGSRSVYCFLDFEGNIYKSESWKKPAKHIRGRITDPNYSIGKALGKYGAIYLR